jgi:hypothetical protein
MDVSGRTGSWLISGVSSFPSDDLSKPSPYHQYPGDLACIKPLLLVLTYHLPMRRLVLYSLVALGEDTYSFFCAA